MPRQNRVTPDGSIIATPERGTLFGNRGCLHNERGEIRRHHRGTRWIYCLLQFKSRRRALVQPGRYTELFFLDEATALAAGHRPCAECQRARFNEFCQLWKRANPALAGEERLPAPALDAVLHGERLTADGTKRTFTARAGELPPGTFATISHEQPPLLRQERGWLPWSPAGYGAPIALAPEQTVHVLTPHSVVQTLAHGFQPRDAISTDSATV